MDNQKPANAIESAVPVSGITNDRRRLAAMTVKYGVMGACAGLAFAFVIAFFEAQWNGTHIPKSFITDARGR